MKGLLAVLLGMLLTVGFFLVGCGDDSSSDEHPEGIGNSCVEDADCEIGECYLGPGGGYCTTECENEGATTEECPTDTICKPIQGGPVRCLLICGSESSCDELEDCAEDYCPEGSSCVDISESDLNGCEPDPN